MKHLLIDYNSGGNIDAIYGYVDIGIDKLEDLRRIFRSNKNRKHLGMDEFVKFLKKHEVKIHEDIEEWWI